MKSIMSVFTVNRKNSYILKSNQAIKNHDGKFGYENGQLLLEDGNIQYKTEQMSHFELKPVIILLSIFGNHHFMYKNNTSVIIKIITFLLCLLKLLYFSVQFVLEIAAFLMYRPTNQIVSRFTSYVYRFTMITYCILFINLFYSRDQFQKFLERWKYIRGYSSKHHYVKLSRWMTGLSLLMIFCGVSMISCSFYFFDRWVCKL